ncbi:hypothetical protein HYPDE_30238 [Hyphomicrobium denitrificans 1NES1]|uniref:Uncharacterized protein n=1 Tax=Hyphomicrobium denitrificans 1NES1 TaxID=670307 RepID=N0B636_9HYPH|nr:hypothetical protein HYPDE_30238 [Hyphomicrobium denitrificans 1NES1]
MRAAFASACVYGLKADTPLHAISIDPAHLLPSDDARIYLPLSRALHNLILFRDLLPRRLNQCCVPLGLMGEIGLDISHGRYSCCLPA